MSVNQILIPDAVASLLKEKQREGFYGEITVGITKGEVQFVTVSTRSKLENLVNDHVLKRSRIIVKKSVESETIRNDTEKTSETANEAKKET